MTLDEALLLTRWAMFEGAQNEQRLPADFVTEDTVAGLFIRMNLREQRDLQRHLRNYNQNVTHDISKAMEVREAAEVKAREGLCNRCGWPLAKDPRHGCVTDNCAQRPLPPKRW